MQLVKRWETWTCQLSNGLVYYLPRTIFIDQWNWGWPCLAVTKRDSNLRIGSWTLLLGRNERPGFDAPKPLPNLSKSWFCYFALGRGWELILGSLEISMYESGIVGRNSFVGRRAIQIDIRSHCNDNEKHYENQWENKASLSLWLLSRWVPRWACFLAWGGNVWRRRRGSKNCIWWCRRGIRGRSIGIWCWKCRGNSKNSRLILISCRHTLATFLTKSSISWVLSSTMDAIHGWSPS